MIFFKAKNPFTEHAPESATASMIEAGVRTQLSPNKSNKTVKNRSMRPVLI